MKYVACLLACAVALVGATQASAESFGCGLPETQPLWIEFADGSVEFRQQLFGKPGVVVATNGVERAAEMRSLGAHTVFWHMGLRQMTGTPKAPRDPADTEQRAHALYERAVASTGCSTPIIVLNELNGWYVPTPWPPNIAQYRSNVLLVMQTLAAHGAKPFLLVPGPPRGRKRPNLDGDALQWWQAVAEAGYIIRELYFNAPYIYKRGPIVGSRLRRIAMRQGIEQFTAAGIPVSRLGIVVGFHSGPGKGGREGLQPSSAWFEIVKQEALAAKQVGSELGFSAVISWGWGTFLWAPEGADPDKAAAACVYLWARDPSLCDGPSVAGPGFDSSLTVGQILLDEGVQCVVGEEPITTATVTELESALGDRALALRAALQRLLLEQEASDVTEADARAAERAIVERSFGGDQDAYLAELAARGVKRSTMLEALEDLIRAQAAAARAKLGTLPLPLSRWLRRSQREALRQTICLRDEVPKAGAFSWTSAFPFLALPEPSVSIKAASRTLRRGQGTTLSGTVASVRASEIVSVYALVPGSTRWTLVGEAPVARDGGWQLDVRPRKAGTVRYRAASTTAVSPTVTIHVRGRR